MERRTRRQALAVAGTGIGVGLGTALVAPEASAGATDGFTPIIDGDDLPVHALVPLNGSFQLDHVSDAFSVRTYRGARSGSIAVLHVHLVVADDDVFHEITPSYQDAPVSLCVKGSDLPGDLEPAMPPAEVDPFGQPGGAGVGLLNDSSHSGEGFFPLITGWTNLEHPPEGTGVDTPLLLFTVSTRNGKHGFNLVTPTNPIPLVNGTQLIATGIRYELPEEPA